MSLQEALRLMRLEMGITQADLAEKINKAFVTVNRWENGKGFPSRENAKNILKVAKAGNVSKECYHYLNEMLLPDSKRYRSAREYGFFDLDRDFMFQLADESNNALYVIEADTYNLLYTNRQAERFATQFLSEVEGIIGERRLVEQEDRRCFHYFANKAEPCYFCPLQEYGTENYTEKVLTIPDNGRTFHIHAKKARLKNKTVYIIYLNDITADDMERNALYELTNDIQDGVGIYHVYFDNRISLTFMNETMYKMIGKVRKEELMENGESDLELIHPEDRKRLWTEIRECVAERRQMKITLRMQIWDGQFHQVCIQGRLIKKDTEKFTFYCLFHDMKQ